MLISLNWIKDFVALPENLDPRALAERFTLTTAEVEGVEHLHVEVRRLIAARIVEVRHVPADRPLTHVALDGGDGHRYETVSAAHGLAVGQVVVYAPPGSFVHALGDIGETQVGGRSSQGMILPGDALGLTQAAREAIFLPSSMTPGSSIDSGLFEDWIIEVDNKSITHRPDLWGHYGIAREIAAIMRLPLAPYPVVAEQELAELNLPELPIAIADPSLCPRYSGIAFEGVGDERATLQMQTRLCHVGIRPINLLVDLTNYVMAELGQPMHAFDGDKLDCIEVAPAAPGSAFRTLDGVERTLSPSALMIKSRGKPVALAGIMGGAETEVGETTRRLLLESANFDAATIRRCATALGMRTEASARFEKSLDPANTVLAIQRFLFLARQGFPRLKLTSRLSDCYPQPRSQTTIDVDLQFMDRFVGRHVSVDEARDILERIGFGVSASERHLQVKVPSFRAGRDINMEADVIEEIARNVGYDNIESALPDVTVRYFEPNAGHSLEKATLQHFCRALGFSEIFSYIWYDSAWIKQLGYEPGECIELRNPAGDGLHRLRQSLMPNMLRVIERNRHHLDQFRAIDLGSVFRSDGRNGRQDRNIALAIVARGKNRDDELFDQLKSALASWAMRALERPVAFSADEVRFPWEQEHRTAAAALADRLAGRVTCVPLAMKRKMDEHLSAWSMAVAEINLTALLDLVPETARPAGIAPFPQVDVDYSVLCDATRRYADLQKELASFDHPLLRRLTFVGSYEGKNIPEDKRSLTLRLRLGAADRTLVEDDLTGFRRTFEGFLLEHGLQIRK